MILADTSVWVAHLRRDDLHLFDLLDRGQILSHPFVVGEVILGGVNPQTLTLLQLLPEASVADNLEVLGLIQRRRLAGRAVGYVDTHLVASCLLTVDARLWTFDKSLQSVAAELNILY